jgi:hypoxanthine phosphoribosyltransferase
MKNGNRSTRKKIKNEKMTKLEKNPIIGSPSRHDEDMLFVKEWVLELREPTQKILEKLTPVLESGEIQLIIGDDASGRIPTAIFRKIFDMAYKERGFITPETRFIAGSRDLKGEEKQKKKEKIAEYLERVKKDVEKKFGRTLKGVLVVTDVIDSGRSLDPLIEDLNEMGAEVKVASIGVYRSPESVNRIETRWNAPIFYNETDGAPSVYSKDEVSGVGKNSRDLFSHLFKSDIYYDERRNSEIQEQTNISREIANDVASDVYKKWKKEHEDQKKK